MFTSSLGTVRPQPFEQDTGFLGLKSHSLRWPDIRSSLITAVHPKTSFSHLKEGVGRTEYGPCTQRVPTDPKQHRVLQESNPEYISSFSPHFESGEHVPEDPGHGLEGLAVGDRQPVDGARRLPGDPLPDAGEAEGVLAVGGLSWIFENSRTDGANKLLVHRRLGKSRHVVSHGNENITYEPKLKLR